nr:hypothetical protein [Tanacetum cinerariifolium]
MPIPPPSPLTPLSSPLPQIPSPPLPASAPILPIPLPTASPPLQLLSSDHSRDVAEEEALTSLEGANTRVTELDAVQEQDTHDIYGVMEDAQGRQTEMFHRVETLVDD